VLVGDHSTRKANGDAKLFPHDADEVLLILRHFYGPVHGLPELLFYRAVLGVNRLVAVLTDSPVPLVHLLLSALALPVLHNVYCPVW
jgi:hypothetical protein